MLSIDVKFQGFYNCSVWFQLGKNKQATAARCPLKANDNKTKIEEVIASLAAANDYT